MVQPVTDRVTLRGRKERAQPRHPVGSGVDPDFPVGGGTPVSHHRGLRVHDLTHPPHPPRQARRRRRRSERQRRCLDRATRVGVQVRGVLDDDLRVPVGHRPVRDDRERARQVFDQHLRLGDQTRRRGLGQLQRRREVRDEGASRELALLPRQRRASRRRRGPQQGLLRQRDQADRSVQQDRPQGGEPPDRVLHLDDGGDRGIQHRRARGHGLGTAPVGDGPRHVVDAVVALLGGHELSQHRATDTRSNTCSSDGTGT